MILELIVERFNKKIKMKLRTAKKQKSNDYDIGCDSLPDQTHKKTSTSKTQTQKDALSSNEVIFTYLYNC